MARCDNCKKKTPFPNQCPYCPGKFCIKCGHLELHKCPGIDIKKNKDLKNLEKKIEFKPDDKYAFLH
jgi:predicted nucleic acid binding AN1-type Zn finger protein